MSSMFNTTLYASLFSSVLILASCSSAEPEGSPPPLRPLIYTEFPNMTPEATAVRERRLTRQLLEGATAGQWGDLEFTPPPNLPPLGSPEALGQAVFDALISQKEELWEHVFVGPRDYAALVHVDLERAEEFVDVQIGKSLSTWTLFRIDESSETPDGGLGAIFSFEEIRLGQGRTIEGPIARDDQEIVQYWGSTIRLRFRDTDIFFDLTVPKILRLSPSRQKSLTEGLPRQDIYVVASEIVIDQRLNTLVRVGLHLKPQLLRSREYPYPLKVGNFWRYRRQNVAGGDTQGLDSLDSIFGEGVEGLDGNEVIQEVEAVERYGPYRLVHLSRRYNDQNLSRYNEYWVLTPRRIYHCTRQCVGRVRQGDLAWLLEYFTHQVPTHTFPLRQGMAWSAGGRETDSATFTVDSQWYDVETSAGSFPGTLAIDGRGPLGDVDPHYRAPQRRFFSPGTGIVRRVIETSDRRGQTLEIIEELVEYRIMP